MLQMLDRVKIIGRMESLNLSLKNTGKYTMKQLADACAGMEECDVSYQGTERYLRVQRELIQNPLFARIYKKMMECGVTDSSIQCWLEEADRAEDVLTNYADEQLVKMAMLKHMDDKTKFDYLRYFSAEKLEEEAELVLLHNLGFISSQRKSWNMKYFELSALTDSQRKLLLKPFFEKYINFSGEKWGKQMAKLDESPMVQEILDFLCQENVVFTIEDKELDALLKLDSQTPRKVRNVYDNLGSNRQHMSDFMSLWFGNGALQYELDCFLEKTELFQEEIESIIGTHIGYTNALYGGQLNIPFEKVSNNKKQVLYYAIVHKKRHFLELVSNNFDCFNSLDFYSMLFEPDFYERCNLNTLTCKNIAESRGNGRLTSHLKELENREYTFAELKLLRYADSVYISLYNRLSIERVDDRLIVMRQLLKNNLLPNYLSEEQVNSLADKLSQKPLSAWYENEFSHISGISKGEVIRFLLKYDILERFLPQIHTKEELYYANRNAEALMPYKDWNKARNEIIALDRDFLKLKEELELSNEFIMQNECHIKDFLLQEGAEMSRIYYEYTPQKEAFRRIVQAELMGKFKEMKYFDKDLEKEISYPVNEGQKKNWQSNGKICGKELEVLEMDDFYTTLRIGTLPHKTCLSYADGMHRECILAGYDSNKKILLAKKHGEVVGRAVIRLTKGRFQDSEAIKKKELEFVDLMNKNESGTNKEGGAENLVLFLETPYFAHISQAEEEKVMRMFVDYVTEKAGLLDAVSVLACSYSGAYEDGCYVRMGYYIYISKSKSGAQYLDSFSGQATSSTEGSYKQNTLLVSRDEL